MVEQLTFNATTVGLVPVELGRANAALAEWGHYLGPVSRPFGTQSWQLEVDGMPVSVAVSASTVSATAAGLARGQLVELARLCSMPGYRWATRPMLRLWREVAARRWPYWPVAAAVAYSQNERHGGQIYRFDGWTRATDAAGSTGGGGTWSRARRAGDIDRGQKSLWVWHYEPTGAPGQAAGGVTDVIATGASTSCPERVDPAQPPVSACRGDGMDSDGERGAVTDGDAVLR